MASLLEEKPVYYGGELDGTFALPRCMAGVAVMVKTAVMLPAEEGLLSMIALVVVMWPSMSMETVNESHEPALHLPSLFHAVLPRKEWAVSLRKGQCIGCVPWAVVLWLTNVLVVDLNGMMQQMGNFAAIQKNERS